MTAQKCVLHVIARIHLLRKTTNAVSRCISTINRGRAFVAAIQRFWRCPRGESGRPEIMPGDMWMYILNIILVQRVAPRNRGERSRRGSRVVEPRSRELATNGRISRARHLFPLSPSFSLFPGFFFFFYDRWSYMRDREKRCSRTHFSRWSPDFVALSPWTTLLAGLLALKSDATASFFRPALGAALTAGTADSAGFALKSILIDCRFNWGLIFFS